MAQCRGLLGCLIGCLWRGLRGADVIFGGGHTARPALATLFGLAHPRPGIGSYVVNCLSQHMHSPLQSHMKAALRVLRYLKGSPGLGLASKRYTVKCSVDIHRGDLLWSLGFLDRSCTREGCSLILLIMLQSHQQFLCVLGKNFGFLANHNVSTLYPVELHYDNSSRIQVAANPMFHEKSKHFEIDVHFVRENVSAGIIKTIKIHKVADIFTKCLGVVHRGRGGEKKKTKKANAADEKPAVKGNTENEGIVLTDGYNPTATLTMTPTEVTTRNTTEVTHAATNTSNGLSVNPTTTTGHSSPTPVNLGKARADDEGLIEVKRKKSGGNYGGNKHIKTVLVKPKTQYEPKAKQSTAGTCNSVLVLLGAEDRVVQKAKIAILRGYTNSDDVQR
ncbi:hypothetical protein Tco_0661164 [Tanacetum coccineum]